MVNREQERRRKRDGCEMDPPSCCLRGFHGSVTRMSRLAAEKGM